MEIWWANTQLITVMMLLLWVWSVFRKDASVVDPWWSMGFFLLTLQTGALCGWAPGKALLATLVGVWALRLWAYLLWRSWGEGEDPRYTAFRERYGPSKYWLVSLFQVFCLQGALILVIASPLRVALAKTAPDPIVFSDVLGAALVLIGLGFESFGDAQLAEFKADPANRGQVCDRGLWRYTRHPNYFGEAVLWWGFWLCAWDADGGPLTVFAPCLMTYLLLRVSGVTLLEKGLSRTKPEYEAYKKRTSAFFPWPPKPKETRP